MIINRSCLLISIIITCAFLFLSYSLENRVSVLALDDGLWDQYFDLPKESMHSVRGAEFIMASCEPISNNTFGYADIPTPGLIPDSDLEEGQPQSSIATFSVSVQSAPSDDADNLDMVSPESNNDDEDDDNEPAQVTISSSSRGRKRSKFDSNEDESPEEKRRKFLERNRIAGKIFNFSIFFFFTLDGIVTYF